MLQPADIAWFRPLKALYNDNWNDWVVNSEKTFTKSGNMRSPGYAQIVIWLSQIWEAFDSSILENSFDQAGVTSNVVKMFHRQLRYLISNKKFIDDVVDDNARDVDGFQEGEELTINDNLNEDSDMETDTESDDENI